MFSIHSRDHEEFYVLGCNSVLSSKSQLTYDKSVARKPLVETDCNETKLNSVAFSPQANYTDRATAACGRS
jgi:hypothetical protein